MSAPVNLLLILSAIVSALAGMGGAARAETRVAAVATCGVVAAARVAVRVPSVRPAAVLPVLAATAVAPVAAAWRLAAIVPAWTQRRRQ